MPMASRRICSAVGRSDGIILLQTSNVPDSLILMEPRVRPARTFYFLNALFPLVATDFMFVNLLTLLFRFARLELAAPIISIKQWVFRRKKPILSVCFWQNILSGPQNY